MIDQAETMESQFGHLFDKVIVNGDIAVAFRELKADLERLEQAEVQWVPAEWVCSSPTKARRSCGHLCGWIWTMSFCPVLLIFPFISQSCDWNSSVPYGVNRNTLSLSLCLHLSRSQFFCWHLAEITSACRTEREEQGTSPELVAECNPSLPSCKHQHVIILTAATLQLTVMYTRETLLVQVSETFCQRRAAQNRHKQENTPLDYITHGLSAARSWNQTVDRRDRAPDVLK